MAPQLTLYRAKKACSLIPHILLHELNLFHGVYIPFDTVLMTFGPNGVESVDGSLSAEAYRRINPDGLIPALKVNNDVVITENPAILTYIADLVPDRNLLGRDALERAKVHQWLCWMSGTLHGYGYGMILAPGRFSADEAAHPAIVKQGRTKIDQCYARIEANVQGEHIVGNRLTVADISLYNFWLWGQWHGFEMNKRYPKYATLVKALERRDSVKATLGVEGLPFQFPQHRADEK